MAQTKSKNIREDLELYEMSTLSEYASLSKRAKRVRPEAKCQYRTEFQRDRDRILHSNSFRRLKHKTQVFFTPSSDHYRTRLTHTLEVSQIARTMARCLRLNEDLTEAIALGHDLGHSPFGHAGEQILNEICPHGYKHYLQSIRVVEYIEKNGEGLNLTYEVKNGIATHTNGIAKTREGQLVRLADTIAYMNHDIDDAIRAGILKVKDIPFPLINILGNTKSKRITTLVASIVDNGAEVIAMPPKIRRAHDELKDFMFQNVYLTPIILTEAKKSKNLVEQLYDYYKKQPENLPDDYKKIAKRYDVDRAVCDYISGMSDSFLIRLYNDLFIPLTWK
ncbi:deoxyguanosinetriphosphate triphosphohydrolase-like protein [Clostridia bacterium]|nr:deoxyguanosinetriphosphate triphosphohydrolase-like protein [Clostridia bacterium]